MSLQIECSVEESITIRAGKILGNSINVVHPAYVVVVSQRLHCIFVLLYTSSGKFTDNAPIYNNYIKQQNVEK